MMKALQLSRNGGDLKGMSGICCPGRAIDREVVTEDNSFAARFGRMRLIICAIFNVHLSHTLVNFPDAIKGGGGIVQNPQ